MNGSPQTSYGFYHLCIESQGLTELHHTNNERAYTLSLLQDYLSPKFVLSEIPPHRQLASCIDLLCFSITRRAVHLVVFTIDPTIVVTFAYQLKERLVAYQQEHSRPSISPIAAALETESRITMHTLAGPHQALKQTIELHLLHQDWEYDRYSSIGFYLHDRRGDWMRFWRLSKLYNNESSEYRHLIEFQLATLPHG